MKVNLMVFNTRTDRFHVDSFDLYHARSRRTFLAEAAEEIGAAEPQFRSDLGQVLLKLEQLQHEQSQVIRSAHARGPKLTDAEGADALELLRDENLLDRILDDFDACGIVGERTGKLVGYLVATSRLLDKPLGLIIQSSSAAGKSSLMNAILSFMPGEQQFACSAMTGQSLYYAANIDLRHKILSIAEEEGVRNASYALKLLQSEGQLSIVTTAKERGTGRTAVERHEVHGPVAVMLTTTDSDVDPELLNRSFVVSVDEQATQTEAIQRRQRDSETLEAFLAYEKAEQIRKRHQNAQRLLRPLAVFNPFGPQLGFTSQRVRNRRDQLKYLALIRPWPSCINTNAKSSVLLRTAERPSISRLPSVILPSPTPSPIAYWEAVSMNCRNKRASCCSICTPTCAHKPSSKAAMHPKCVSLVARSVSNSAGVPLFSEPTWNDSVVGSTSFRTAPVAASWPNIRYCSAVAATKASERSAAWSIRPN